jgi:TonB family protein
MKGPQVVEGTTAPPSAPSPAGSPGDTRSDQGTLSTRESDASAIIDVPMSDWRNGKPLARQGIMLQTFRPRFNALNIIDGLRMNPIVELVVGRDGVPQHVVIARSSGNPGVNEAIRSSLYKWRASGKKISDLKPGQTVTIRIKLIMLAD